jgi:hypothetical protein
VIVFSGGCGLEKQLKINKRLDLKVMIIAGT